jgi:hypothetical protein
VSYLSIYQKIIGVVSTETWFFEKRWKHFKIKISKSKKKKLNLNLNLNLKLKIKLKKKKLKKKKSNFQFFRIFFHTNFFFKKSYLSLSTDYTYKFLVDTCLSPRHLKLKFLRLLKKKILARNPETLWGTLYVEVFHSFWNYL